MLRRAAQIFLPILHKQSFPCCLRTRQTPFARSPVSTNSHLPARQPTGLHKTFSEHQHHESLCSFWLTVLPQKCSLSSVKKKHTQLYRQSMSKVMFDPAGLEELTHQLGDLLEHCKLEHLFTSNLLFFFFSGITCSYGWKARMGKLSRVCPPPPPELSMCFLMNDFVRGGGRGATGSTALDPHGQTGWMDPTKTYRVKGDVLIWSDLALSSPSCLPAPPPPLLHTERHSTHFCHVIPLLLLLLLLLPPSSSCAPAPRVTSFACVPCAPRRDHSFTRLFIFIILSRSAVHQSFSPSLSSFHLLPLSLFLN